MTATVAFDKSASTADPPARRFFPRRGTERVARGDVPPLSSRLQLVRAALVLVLVLAATLFLQLVLVSSLQQSAA